ncbi:hypothetical protein WBP07_07535 [Novosphingobium sp. BL-8A]|uniref:hypothetical protein n=1 Tax=Novosphingobium sp. BL-8A TaxID=3127639 RepID=UPI003756FEE7
MDFLDVWPVILLTGIAGTFLWNGVRGIREGTVRIPLQFLNDDEFERGTTMFGFAVAMNFLGGLGVLAGLIWWKLGNG